MAEDAPIAGMAPVVAHYGFWPSFHDAAVHKIEVDGEANTLTIAFILNEMMEIDAGNHLARLTLRWYEVYRLSLAADYRASEHNWLWRINFCRAGEWLDMELSANDGIGGTVRARRIEVTHFEPIAS